MKIARKLLHPLRRGFAWHSAFSLSILLSSFLLLLAGCEKRHNIEEVRWTTMGTIASFKYRDPADAPKAHVVRETFAEVERLLNAHDETSELRRLAALGDAEILANCDPSVRPCYEAAFCFRDMTGGVFNPRWRGPATMDLGAIAKGFALDIAAQKIGECDALIDLGGNLKACGGIWKVGIYGSDRTIELRKGMASSTSGEYFRGRHIKDGRTGGDVANASFSVTVVHPESAMTADALSTILFIMKPSDGDAFANEHFHDCEIVRL